MRGGGKTELIINDEVFNLAHVQNVHVLIVLLSLLCT